VNIFTKRNALIGYLTLNAISRKQRRLLGRQKKYGWKLPALVALGIVSVGVLAVVAVMLRRQREPEQIEGYVVAGEPEEFDASSDGEELEPSEAA
jgi:hypothetical protein